MITCEADKGKSQWSMANGQWSMMRLLLMVAMFFVECSMFNAFAQIKIGGNVYGGGNEGNVGEGTSVTIHAGDLNEVYGGARMADVKGSTFVNIDGEHASDNIIITSVYGGNDIAGTIGSEGKTNDIPDELTQIKTKGGNNEIDNTWNAFVRTSPTRAATEGERLSLLIGSMFGGGNGDYDYTSDDSPYKGKVKPEIGKSYLEILGGCIAHLYGGGNNATVKVNTTICLNNNSPVLTETNVWPKNLTSDEGRAQLVALAKRMGLSTAQSNLTSYAFNFARVFGGNNKAEMAIRPTWDLQGGTIRDLYSGGNQGGMTYENGILLAIKPKVSANLKIENVFGGCRMADVNPAKKAIAEETIDGTYFPAGYAARVLVTGGDIQNVYGGNDISGTIYGGNAVGIHSSINGDVYGGGNGSYAYTDNVKLKDDPNYGDFYYTVPEGMASVEALRAFRPNAESVSIRLVGKDADHPTIIGGAVYCGGNSATLHNDDPNKGAAAELKIGSYVIADKVFLGNNGANMATEDILKQYAGTVKDSNGSDQDFSQMNLASDTKDANGRTEFDKYMDGVTMDVMPRVAFDDVGTYEPYSTYFGSFYCGGNVGSMKMDGAINLNFKDKVVVFDKVVGGSNEANVYKTAYNPQYLGGLLGSPDANGNKLILNFEGLKIQPMRWKKDANGDYALDSNGNRQLEWNTISARTGEDVAPITEGSGTSDANDLDRRLKGGNIYGGCYNNGHVEGNVIINLNATIHERDRLFDVTDEGDTLYENVEKGEYNISKRNTGVILSEQGMDVLGAALNVFGGGYGGDSEIWGSATINLNKGYTFQIFGGGEQGAIGNAISHEPDADDPTKHNLTYAYDQRYSTYINLNGATNLPGVARGAAGDSQDMAECEFIYGGAFEGPIAGDTHINLNNGRIFNSFAGSCNADVLGHTETYVGQNGFPWIRDHIYGGNDLGGRILGNANFSGRIRDEVKSMVDGNYGVASYMEYTQGRVRNILGGCFGDYDYSDDAYRTRVTQKPYLHNAFVNFRPNSNADNAVERVFGAGEGYPGDRDGDKSQDHSYVLIDVADGVENFANTEIFGAGAYNGLGMRYTAEDTFNGNVDINEASAVIDLLRGRVGAAYGGSLDEGVTRRTLVNVPKESTIIINNIFGGAFGNHILPPCDVYESNVNYRSDKAFVNGAIYGGNNNVRRTIYAHVNVSAPVRKENGYSATVYGAGKGMETWAEYTEVNLEEGANVWEVYGGGEMGNVLNAESVQKYMQLYVDKPADKLLTEDQNLDADEDWNAAERWVGGTVGGTLKDEWKDEWKKAWKTAWTIGNYYDPVGEYKRYVTNNYVNLNNTLVRKAEMDDRSDRPEKTYRYNTNVIIHQGATVGNYAYGGGYGDTSKPMSGCVYGTTYIALLGGTVNKDIYAAGTSGSVNDIFGCGAYDANDNPTGFTASANAYVEGGMLRNVFGGGWRGGVGFHAGLISDVANNDGDLEGETHVIIGKLDGTTFTKGIPAIKRNVYGGGEGGAIYGTAYVKVNNGRIGYRYENNDYVEELDDVKAGDNLLDRSGNVFGGGYVANSYVDVSDVQIYGGIVRGGLYGGGEIGPIGRGTVNASAPAPVGTFRNGAAKIYKAGETHVALYKGHVMRDVFGGGRGYDNWDGEGYMTEDEKKTMDLSSKGYVFGSTDVKILGGEVGTVSGVADGYGNVFGGGNVGYVYSATGTKTEKEFDGDKTYYYYAGGNLTNDCSVLVTPYCQAKADVSIPNGGGSYKAGEYIPSSELDKLKSKSSSDKSIWDNMDLSGVVIRNAVFAGGNVSVGDNAVYANQKTVLGNVSANIVDVYNRDLITIGTEHVGGLYGDGNLTLVDGYRELNITNYGTDYYGMSDNISIEEYRKLTDREKAYFALEYRCTTGYTVTTASGDKTYTVGQRITEEVYNALDEQYKKNWELWGFCSIYAGRLMNTIQRADFCGIFGSRLVMQGAKDRVPSVADKTDYTVNRVGEVSLNRVNTVAGETDEISMTHGNYFGIYSVVNYMGGLTSDVNFYTTTRTTDNANYAVDGKTFYEWKEAFPKERKRNNGTSINRVALASGVYLELTTEKSTPTQKDWGYITGVAQLELINVKAGLGGGYVYAKNEHGSRSNSGNDRTILSPYNNVTAAHAKAVTNKLFVYSDADADQKEVQTSGNFVHNVKQIIDDCYPTSNAYKGSGAAPAHYWFIRGTSYVYDQYITAYTGVSNAYSKAQKIPLNINAASYGKMKLEDVKTNLYAYYYSTEPNERDRTPLQNTDENAANYSVLVNNDVTYHLNDSITYWDYLQLSEVDQRHFVTDTYLTIAECKIGNTTYPEGTVLLPSEYNSLKASAPVKVIDGEEVPSVYHVNKEEDVDFDFVFRRSNNLSHDHGYVVTYAVDNPSAWKTQDPDCTYSPTASGVYGQRFYEAGEIIDKTTHDDYEGMGSNKPTDTADKKQAKMGEAYVTKEDVKFTDGEKSYNFIAGTPLCKEEYSAAAWTTIKDKVEPALVCMSTIEFDGENAKNSVLYGEVLTTERYNKVIEIYQETYKVSDTKAKEEVGKSLSKAYLCYEDGYYGGGYFEAGQKYTALKAWSSLSAEDRENFTFNYDALNLLIDPRYSGNTKLYDNNEAPFTYSSVQPIDYQAQYTGTTALSYSGNSVAPGQIIGREQYEAIPNEQYHYSPIKVDDTTVYVVHVPFVRGDNPYTTGQTITAEAYGYLTDDQKSHVTTLTFDKEDVNSTYYYCREDYRISSDENGHAVKDVLTGTTIDKGSDVKPGVLITDDDYKQLTNLQKDFTIQGNAPEELTTLYVARQSDVFDLQKDRIITVIFSYDYTESDESGTHIEPISERHIVNIHIHFESGVPEIGTLRSPAAALPGDNVGLIQPTVKPGAYEIMGGGWEIFENEEDAERHRNGVEFTNKTPVYWYQDGQLLAYYAKTYLGKTYSNYVPMSVANYHDLKAVMDAKDNHLYIDHPDVKRASKIYINDYSGDDKSGLDLFRELYDLSLHQTTYDAEGNPQKVSGGALDGHTGLNNSRVQNGKNLEFFLHANTAPKTYSGWTPIGDGTTIGGKVSCFEGTLHGEGYYISGLDKSLFGHLCGHVYNLGVMGSMTSAGIADTGDGYVENCWVKTTGTPDGSVYAVFGDPSDDSSTAWRQIENCYYTTAAGDYKTTGSKHGLATRMPDKAFYNGEVAFDLNGFYLKERYNRQASAADKVETYKYVENRYSVNDFDFIYSNGTIPTDDDPRLKKTEEGDMYYEPIWPDDYLFFGQGLSYGHTSRTHDEVPTHLTKDDTRQNQLTISNASNRVYRAPGYFSSKTMGTVHYNPYAVFAAQDKNRTMEAYPRLTAVDFTGYQDKTYTKDNSGGIFFRPALDVQDLTGMMNADLTKNLLVYSPNDPVSSINIVSQLYLKDPAYAELNTADVKADYRAVDKQATTDIHGHVVFGNGTKYTATNDHLLVDKNDFNAPIAYTFTGGKRMWYQRDPQTFVRMTADGSQGWEGVSLPFDVELATTQQKGEITHFYGTSTKGHEYWLREYRDITGVANADKATAIMRYPDAVAGYRKDCNNTFLWDYYYEYSSSRDANSDEYQNYYNESRSYNDYAMQLAGTPYIIGFPSDYYYEFDLSGSFEPENTFATVNKLDKQTVTFASQTNATINVSDDETKGVAHNGYTFKPNYLTTEVAANDYVLSATGGSYDKTTAATTVLPFRPYFVKTSASGVRTRSIVFSDDSAGLENGELDPTGRGEGLFITPGPHKIIVESRLHSEADVRIITPAGITLNTFTIKPGETIETRIVNQGVYIVQTADARFTKKLSVR